MIVDEEYYLEHFGVKGMKWGVRKERKAEKQAARAAMSPADRRKFDREEQRRKAKTIRNASRAVVVTTLVLPVLLGAIADRKISTLRPSKDGTTFVEKNYHKKLSEMDKNKMFQNAKQIQDFIDKSRRWEK